MIDSYGMACIKNSEEIYTRLTMWSKRTMVGVVRKNRTTEKTGSTLLYVRATFGIKILFHIPSIAGEACHEVLYAILSIL